MGSKVAAVAVSVGVLATPLTQAWAEDQPNGTLSLSISADASVRDAQHRILETWAVVADYFVDQEKLQQVDWQKQLIDALAVSSSENTKQGADAALEKMVSALGDPFTRVVGAEEFKAFQVTRISGCSFRVRIHN